MPTPPMDPKIVAAVVKDLKLGTMTQREIADKHGVAVGSVGNIRQRAGIPVRIVGASRTPMAEQPESQLFENMRRLLKKGSRSKAELADDLDCSPKRVAELLKEMKARGGMLVETLDGKFEMGTALGLNRQTTEIKVENQPWNRFGVVSDNHLCNRHSRLDVLKAAYDTFEREGITTVFNPGNWIDGEARFTKPECIVRPGVDAQIEYMLENYPQRKGITTHYIAGDDHEGWYQQRECLEIGRDLQLKAEEGGRNDLKYLGYAEADVELKNKGGSIVMRVVHPGGGSAYAVSYTDQKRVESYQGGEKPQIELVGHYHKYNVGYPREVYTVQAGCTCDQTLFMRKKRLQAMVGFVILEIQQDLTDGHLLRARHEWFPFFDRKFYEKRYL
jgi:DNA-binding Lrp family transcriptional regulator